MLWPHRLRTSWTTIWLAKFELPSATRWVERCVDRPGRVEVREQDAAAAVFEGLAPIPDDDVVSRGPGKSLRQLAGASETSSGDYLRRTRRGHPWPARTPGLDCHRCASAARQRFALDCAITVPARH